MTYLRLAEKVEWFYNPSLKECESSREFLELHKKTQYDNPIQSASPEKFEELLTGWEKRLHEHLKTRMQRTYYLSYKETWEKYPLQLEKAKEELLDLLDLKSNFRELEELGLYDAVSNLRDAVCELEIPSVKVPSWEDWIKERV